MKYINDNLYVYTSKFAIGKIKIGRFHKELNGFISIYSSDSNEIVGELYSEVNILKDLHVIYTAVQALDNLDKLVNQVKIKHPEYFI